MAMTQNELSEKAEVLIGQLEDLFTENVPQKGNTSEDCFSVALKAALLEVERLIDGMRDEDLIPDEDWEGTNRAAGYNFSKMR